MPHLDSEGCDCDVAGANTNTKASVQANNSVQQTSKLFSIAF